jgi:hypothetical protein
MILKLKINPIFHNSNFNTKLLILLSQKSSNVTFKRKTKKILYIISLYQTKFKN